MGGWTLQPPLRTGTGHYEPQLTGKVGAAGCAPVPESRVKSGARSCHQWACDKGTWQMWQVVIGVAEGEGLAPRGLAGTSSECRPFSEALRP